MKLCITTVSSADQFSYFIPLFVYTAKRAYPEYYVKVFVRGKLDDNVRAALGMLKDYSDWEVLENMFTEFPNRVSICSTLRHLIPREYFDGFDYVYITDIDFLIFRHEPTLGEYFAKRIERCGQPYAAFRGSVTKPLRKEISKVGWRGNFTRIADGTLMLKTPEYFNKTDLMRRRYYKFVKKSKHDQYDFITPASYREYTEVMFYRILRQSGLQVPHKKRHFLDGKKYDVTFRDIHLGDMKFNVKKRVKKNITSWNIRNFHSLEKEELWKKLCKICLMSKMVRESIERLRKAL